MALMKTRLYIEKRIYELDNFQVNEIRKTTKEDIAPIFERFAPEVLSFDRETVWSMLPRK